MLSSVCIVSETKIQAKLKFIKLVVMNLSAFCNFCSSERRVAFINKDFFHGPVHRSRNLQCGSSRLSPSPDGLPSHLFWKSGVLLYKDYEILDFNFACCFLLWV